SGSHGRGRARRDAQARAEGSRAAHALQPAGWRARPWPEATGALFLDVGAALELVDGLDREEHALERRPPRLAPVDRLRSRGLLLVVHATLSSREASGSDSPKRGDWGRRSSA